MSIQGDIEASRTRTSDWVGVATPLQVSAFLFVGTIALLFAGLQPILLGALVGEHRLTAAALGQTATTEFFAVGVGVGVMGAISAPTRLRLKGVLAAGVLTLADVAAVRGSGLTILADRAIAGLAEGAIVWLAASLISRAATPARWAGVFLVTQGAAQFALAVALPATVMGRWGADGGFLTLGATAGLALLAMFALPTSLPPLIENEGYGNGGYSGPALLSLTSVFLVFAFFIGFFAYFGQFATQARLTEDQGGLAVAIAVGLSIFGSGAAAALAHRITYFTTALVCLPVNLAVMAVFAGHPSAGVFLSAAAVFGFFWGLFMPFQVALVIEVDPTRRASLLVPGIQGVGAAAGPLLCSFFVTDADAHGALWVMAFCLIASFLIGAALHVTRRRSSTEAKQARRSF